ncbi:hypothetical protein B0H14DRAFT_3508268 [Mycena olivaceomarginata]|nr:hypothetical protein B0H14DRAFT_3508268 [Mycena olivaceomarginata]
MSTELASNTVSQVNHDELLSAAATFDLDRAGNVTALRARVRAYIDANEHHMDNARHLPLFSPRHGPRVEHPSLTPPTPRMTQTTNPTHPMLHPTPRASVEPDTERNAEIELLKSLPPAALAKAIGSLFNNGTHEATSVHNTHISAASNSRKRPPRTPGLAASNAGYLIPEAIRAKFEQGWKSIVPLHFLTDKFCAHSNLAAAQELNDIFRVDSSSGSMVSMARELPIAPELSLSFDE